MDGGIIKHFSLSPLANLFPAPHHHANQVPFIGACKEHGEETSLQSPEPQLHGNDITGKVIGKVLAKT